MTRSVPEWVGKTDDTKAPEHVVLRIFRTHGGICHISGRKIRPRDAWQADHIIAIVNGGQNRESNMAPALIDSHKVKTAADVAMKAKIDRVAKRHAGIAQPKGNIKSHSFPKRAPKRQPRPALPPRVLFERIT